MFKHYVHFLAHHQNEWNMSFSKVKRPDFMKYVKAYGAKKGGRIWKENAENYDLAVSFLTRQIDKLKLLVGA